MNVYYHLMYSSEGAHVAKFNITEDELQFDLERLTEHDITPTVWCTNIPISERLLEEMISVAAEGLNAPHHTAGWN